MSNKRQPTATKKKRQRSRPEPAPLPNAELMDQNQVLASLAIRAPSTLWEGIRHGYFPKPIRLGPRMVRWRTADIRKLIDEGTGEWRPGDALTLARIQKDTEAVGA